MPTEQNRREEIARRQLPYTLENCASPPPSRRGKVREIYERGDEVLLVATDRISAFDVVLGTIPFKGATLTEQAVFWLEQARAVGPTHLLERPEAQVMRVKRAEPFAFEFVVRGYLAGSLLREPATTRGEAWGLRLDPQQAPYTAFEGPLVTPTTKEAVGQHDVPCSIASLQAKGVATRRQLEEVQERALALFALGSRAARERGLLLVDTKYEFGVIEDEIVLIDEVHTADSSRYWVASSYEERLSAGLAPEMLDKERLRRWLREERNFVGEGPPPSLPDEVRVDLASFYWSLTETITGRDFRPDTGPVTERIGQLAHAFLGH